LHPTPKRTDFHPHDRFVASAVRELARIEQQLNLAEQATRTPVKPIMRHLRDLVPWWGQPEPIKAPQKALWNLLHEPDFIDLLPFVLEKFNTIHGYIDLPNRGRLRNLDRQFCDTYYTPLDLARWLASQTSERACNSVRHLLTTGGRENAEEALRQLLEMRICDMSCGAGILLREALEPIVKAYSQVYEALGKHETSRFMSHAPFLSRGLIKLQALTTNVYGVDISPRAVESAQTVLAVWAADELQTAGLTATAVARWLRLNLRVGSGSHWSIGVEEASQGLTAEMLCRATLERESLRRSTVECEDAHEPVRDHCTVSGSHPEVEIVRMFPEVFVGSKPGFTCIVSNPPFGKLPEGGENSEDLRPFNCFSFKLRQEPSPKWQYPKFVEGLYRLVQRGGFGAIVTPLNLAYGRQFAGLRAAIEKAPLRSTFTFFDRSPDALFGDKVKTRNVVLLVEPSERNETEIWTTQLLRWTRKGRPDLWRQIKPTQLSSIAIRGSVPKLGTMIEVEGWKSLRSRSKTLRSAIIHSSSERPLDAAVYVNATAYNWLPAFRRVPTAIASAASPSMRTYNFRSETEADVVYSCLVSSLTFWLWTVESDGFHVTDSFILNLPFMPDNFSAREARDLSALGQAHERAIRTKPTVKSNAGLKILNFNRQSAAHISHQIDGVIASALSLPSAFLELVRERVTNLVYVGREQTRATVNICSERDAYAEVC
jgi:hypothetical protein